VRQVATFNSPPSAIPQTLWASYTDRKQKDKMFV